MWLVCPRRIVIIKPSVAQKPGYQLELVSANRVFAAELLSQGSEQEPAQVRLLQELAAYSEAPLRLILLQGVG